MYKELTNFLIKVQIQPIIILEILHVVGNYIFNDCIKSELGKKVANIEYYSYKIYY